MLMCCSRPAARVAAASAAASARPGQVARNGHELATGGGQDKTSARAGEQGDPEVPLEKVQLA